MDNELKEKERLLQESENKYRNLVEKNNDIIFVTGKGHEESLAFGNVEHPWSDELAVNKILKISK